VRLARPAIADEDDRFGTFDVAALGQFVDLGGRDLRRLAESNSSRVFIRGSRASLIRRAMVLRSRSSNSAANNASR
jgi:hypothetical protein